MLTPQQKLDRILVGLIIAMVFIGGVIIFINEFFPPGTR